MLTALAAAGADPAPIAPALDRTLRADTEHFARCAAVRQVVGAGSELAHALHDELELLRRRVLALLAVRYGAERIGAAANRLDSDRDDRRSLAAETLDVTLTPADAVLALPLVRWTFRFLFGSGSSRLSRRSVRPTGQPSSKTSCRTDRATGGQRGPGRALTTSPASSCAREKAGRKGRRGGFIPPRPRGSPIALKVPAFENYLLDHLASCCACAAGADTVDTRPRRASARTAASERRSREHPGGRGWRRRESNPRSVYSRYRAGALGAGVVRVALPFFSRAGEVRPSRARF